LRWIRASSSTSPISRSASRKSLDLLLAAHHAPRSAAAGVQELGGDAGPPVRGADDVKFLVRPNLRHRIILKPESEIEGLNADTAMTRILARVEVPRSEIMSLS